MANERTVTKMNERNFESATYRIPDVGDRPPTNMCSICGFKEDDAARLINGFFWLCPDCLKKLRKLVAEDGDT